MASARGAARRRRRGWLRTIAALAAAAVLLVLGRRAAAALAGADIFRVEAIELEGARFLTLDDAIRTAAVEPGAGIWDDTGPWKARLTAHPLVRHVEVGRRLPGTLVLIIVEEEPVALVPTPILEPIDREGRYLPLDPAVHSLDLPVIRPVPTEAEEARPSRARLQPLARAVERLRADPVFFSRTSEVRLERDGSLRIRWGADPEVFFRIDGVVDPLRIRQGVDVLVHALEADPGRRPRTVDLRFADQIVVRY